MNCLVNSQQTFLEGLGGGFSITSRNIREQIHQGASIIWNKITRQTLDRPPVSGGGGGANGSPRLLSSGLRTHIQNISIKYYV